MFPQQNNSSNNPFGIQYFLMHPNHFVGTPASGASSCIVFCFPNMCAFGQSGSLFGTSSPFESTTTAFGGHNSAFGSQAPIPAFGSRVASYSATTETDSGNIPPGKLESISAMPVYKDKSHEELRWVDCQLGYKAFGQNPAFGGFGSTTTPSPFGSATQPSQPAFGSNTQQSQPAFGSSIFGSSTPFGASSQPAFGATSIPAFGASSTPAFGASSTPAFGATSTPAFGATSTSAFGATSTSAFGNTGGAFGMSSTPVFGDGGAFGASSSPVFGSSSTSAFGASSTPAFGASSSPAFSFGSSTQAFGQSSSAFGSSSPFGSTTSAFGGQTSSAFGSQTPTPAFGSTGMGQSGFGGQRGGSRVASYSATTETDSSNTPPGRLESISAMPVYRDKSHEELRWEDYKSGDKGGPLASAPQQTGMAGFNSSTTQTNAFSPSPVFGQSSANPFSSTTPNSNPFAPKTSTFSSGFGTSAPAFSSSAFGSSTSAAAPSIFGSSSSPFGANSSSQAFGSSSSLFNTAAQSTSSPFGSSIFGNTQPSQLFSSAAPTDSHSSSVYGQNTSPFGQTAEFSQSSLSSSPSSELVGSIFSSSTSLTSNALTGFGQTAPSMSAPLQSSQPAQSSGTFSFNNSGQTQPVCASSFIGTAGMFGQNNFEFQAIPQSSTVVTAAPVTNSFGTTPSAQCEKSSMPVQDKPVTLRRKKIQIRTDKNRGPKPGFGGQQGGSRVASYSTTTQVDTGLILVDISAMSVYENKSHEELRWEDYLLKV
ncbi:nuclear pore complex protein NUP98A-like isoform X2 [Vicia villosa]|uniref:nuclear pore complex protein NUP98A-like isoform X2 n=1 Tax=Vicia villosa TaxID=3911 RepID=UPI00273B1FB5|nr:nuclear pore complex protein NUP98A-like isoform X2 [Vicia villosa]